MGPIQAGNPSLLFMPMVDQNNNLLIGLPMKCLAPLQITQNASAGLIMGVKNQDHITPTLKKLHWLPVEQIIMFKV